MSTTTYPEPALAGATAGRQQLALVGGFTIIDFNRLRQADDESAVGIAASIFLDIFNVFLFALDLFGGRRD